ncbi:hypothetical protein O3M35_008470 [Rhynocoris fuscipes]|uniref:Phosphomevalonate kinase n=1 Tax=Rhynocoris fuscipes TaxID=488301 RepID=A0AAW1DDU2_9HEMI
MYPLKVYLFSGKRKCGKDYVTDRLFESLDKEYAVIIKISAPIKEHWAKVKGLDYEQLLSSSSYKEKYRKEMLPWSEKMRNDDYGIFCRAAVDMFNAREKPIWIVSDIRRKTDIRWFKENFGAAIKTIKIIAGDDIRKSRGWVFEEGIDDQETECDLDDVEEWDLIITNHSTDEVDKAIEDMKQEIQECLTRNELKHAHH